MWFLIKFFLCYSRNLFCFRKNVSIRVTSSPRSITPGNANTVKIYIRLCVCTRHLDHITEQTLWHIYVNNRAPDGKIFVQMATKEILIYLKHCEWLHPKGWCSHIYRSLDTVRKKEREKSEVFELNQNITHTTCTWRLRTAESARLPNPVLSPDIRPEVLADETKARPSTAEKKTKRNKDLPSKNRRFFFRTSVIVFFSNQLIVLVFNFC